MLVWVRHRSPGISNSLLSREKWKLFQVLLPRLCDKELKMCKFLADRCFNSDRAWKKKVITRQLYKSLLFFDLTQEISHETQNQQHTTSHTTESSCYQKAFRVPRPFSKHRWLHKYIAYKTLKRKVSSKAVQKWLGYPSSSGFSPRAVCCIYLLRSDAKQSPHPR